MDGPLSFADQPARSRRAILWRALLAIALLASLAGASLTVGAVDAPPTKFVVNVSAEGFDPPVCRISRRDMVAWKNVGTKPIRVVWLDPNTKDFIFDSGLLKPGDTSLPYAGFEFPGTYTFRDEANRSHTGLVILPVWTNSVDPQCSPTGSLPLPRGPVLPALASDR